MSPRTQAIREAILALTDEYDVMTVRQIFYALSVRGVVPKSENQGYRPVQRQVLLMRREGLLPWGFVSDANRWRRGPMVFDSSEDALRQTISTYRRNLWTSQHKRIEVWLEKDALAGVVMKATEPWGVSLMVSRGTSSATFLYEAASAARDAFERQDTQTVLLGLFDYDAAGQRAARAIERGLTEHLDDLAWISRYEHVAVTPEQIEDWNLPTRPAKASDPEARKFGAEAVELDAIPPDRLIGTVSDEIASYVDADAWRREEIVEAEERALLMKITEGFVDADEGGSS